MEMICRLSVSTHKRRCKLSITEVSTSEPKAEFLNAAKRCFELIDKDGGGTLSIDEIISAVKNDEEVIHFLNTCGDENLEFLLHPPRLKIALKRLDTDGSGELDAEEWDVAINCGLTKRLKDLEVERERRNRAARADDLDFSLNFLSNSRKVFGMIDVDGGGTLDKQEIIDAVQGNKKVINFLVNCGEPNLQYLLVPARLEACLLTLDTDNDGEIDAQEWEDAIEDALANKLKARALKREADAAAAAREIENFTADFKNAARHCFKMIDKDEGGTLSLGEIVEAVKSDKDVIKFLTTCGDENLSFLLHPPRLKKALEVLDEDKSGEIDIEEWETAINRGLAKRLKDLAKERERRERAGTKDDEEFSSEFLGAARKVFHMIDKDGSGTLDKEEILRAVRADQEVIGFLTNCGNKNLQYLLVPSRLEAALAVLDSDRDGTVDAMEWEEAIETALATKLEQRAKARELDSKAASKEIEEFTFEFKNAARECFQLIDKDNGGSLDKQEIVDAVKNDQKVIRFLTTCGEDNLTFLLHPPRLAKALEVLDTDNSGEVDIDEWEEAINRGLAKRLDQLANERERREKAARAEDENFSVEFLGAARKVFEMIDVDESGTLDKEEVVTAVRGNKKVINFLVNCGDKNLQYLLVPARLDAALNAMDTDRDGSIDVDEWEECIENALKNKLIDRAAKRELNAKKAAKEIEEFTNEFKNAARECFQMIDTDGGGSLSTDEIVRAVKEDRKVIKFLKTCGEDNLQFLLHPPRLQKALAILDTDKSGEVDIDEWEEAINRGLAKRLEAMSKERERADRAAAKADENFSAEFLSAAREVFGMIDEDESGTLEKAEVVAAVRADKKVINFLTDCGNKNLQYLLVPSRLEAALAQMDTDNDGSIDCDEWEECIEKALANKLEQRANAREAQRKSAQKEIEEFTGEFLNAARQCFLLIDKDNSGTLDKAEIIKAVKDDKKVIEFLAVCGEPNLMFLTQPARLHKALEVLDTSKDGEVDSEEWEEAINRGLAKRLQQLADERERRERAAEKADAEFSVEFLNAARKCFEMIDADESGTLEKAEIVEAIQSNKKVINFLVNCGNQNLQYLLVPVRLEAALVAMDTDRDGHIDVDEWEICIEDALKNKLAARAAKREIDAKNASKEIEEFTNEFLSAARRCFELIDKDGGGTLSTEEIVKAVKDDAEVIDFLKNCGEDNLQFLLHPPRLKKALAVLDEDQSGEIDVEEWETAIQKGLSHRLAQLSAERQRRDAAAAAADEEFSAEFLSAAREVFLMIDKDDSGFLDKTEIVTAIRADKEVIAFLTNCGNKNLQYLLVPSRLESALAQLDSDRDGEIDCNEWEEAIMTGLKNKLEQRAKAREAQSKAAAKEIAKFTSEFLNAARQCFIMIDVDNSGTLEKPEIVKAVQTDKKVIDFLKNCGEVNLQFLLHPPRLDKALDALDTDKSGELDIEEWEAAINRGLAKRLEQMADERERRQRAAEKADADFSLEFLNAAREVFAMIDADDSGTLDKPEIVEAVQNNKKVIKFLCNCGNQNLQYLLVPARLEKALNEMDTDRDGSIDVDEWEQCIEIALQNKLAARAAKRELDAKNAAKENAAFASDFLNAARKCFNLIDKDFSGTLEIAEIVQAVKTDNEVISFLQNCGEDNLQFLLQPARLKKALQALDSDNSGEIDVEEWEEAIQRGLSRRLEQLSEERERRARIAAAADEDFSVEFLTMARAVFEMIDEDESGYLDKQEIIEAVQANKKVITFLQTCGNQNLMYLLEPSRLQQALAVLDSDRDGQIDASEWEDAIENALKAKLSARAAQRRAQEMMERQAAKDLEEFTNEFKNAARHCFELIDVDKGGTLSLEEVVAAVHPKTGIEKVLKFLRTCGEPNLQFLTQPARLKKALEILDVDNSGEIDGDEWEEAINRGLAKRIEQLKAEQERAMRAAAKADGEFSEEFLNAARQCFRLIDKDGSGTLEKEEIVRAVRADKEVIKFLENCGNQNLMYLLVPSRLQACLMVLDTDNDGHVDEGEWEDAIESALAAKLEARAAARAVQAKAAQKEIEEFTNEFLNAAQRCFDLMDKDGGGSLDKQEIITACRDDKEVIKFLSTCGEENLQFLLHPPRLNKALEVLDTSNDGEVDREEWEEAINRGLAKRLQQLADERERRERAALASDAEFSAEFLGAARAVFNMIDVDESGDLEKEEIVLAVQSNQKVIKFLVNCGEENLQNLLVPSRLQATLAVLDTDRDGHIDAMEWESAIESALCQQAGRARGRARAPGQGRDEGDRRVHGRVQERGARMFSIDRQGRRRDPEPRGNLHGGQGGPKGHPVPQDLRRGEPHVFGAPAAAQKGPRGSGRGRQRRNRRRRVGGGHQQGPREAPGAAGGRTRAPRARGPARRRRVFLGIPRRGSEMLRDDR